jgi:hypothetical protein
MSGETGVLGGGKRPFLKRTCRSKSRCGGAANHRQFVEAFGGSRGVRGVRRSRRGGQGVIETAEFLGGGKRPFRKRTCRSKSRCGGAAARVHTLIPNVGFYVLN